MKHLYKLVLLLFCAPAIAAPLYVGTFVDVAGTNNPVATPVTKINGGTGFPMTNWVPAGAQYTNDIIFGAPTYNVPLLSNGLYFAYIPGNSFSNDQGVSFLGDLSAAIYNSGVFIPLTNNALATANSTGPVLTQIYLVAYTNGFDTNGVYADFNGRFTGTVSATSIVPDAALSGNVQLRNNPLNITAVGGGEHKLFSSNTIDGSTLSLINYGPVGPNYADVNFFTAPNQAAAIATPTLWFAIGIGNAGAAFPYKQPYFESYLNQYPIYYVGAGAIFGGLFSTPNNHEGDFIWFQDGTTNTPMFRISRSNKVISNYYQTSFASNVTFLGTQTAPTNALSTMAATTLATAQDVSNIVLSVTVPINTALAAPAAGLTNDGRNLTNLLAMAMSHTNTTPSATNNPVDLNGITYHLYSLTNDFWIPYLTNSLGVTYGHKRLEFECVGATNHLILFPAGFRKGGLTNLAVGSGTNWQITLTNQNRLVLVVGSYVLNPNATNSTVDIGLEQ